MLITEPGTWWESDSLHAGHYGGSSFCPRGRKAVWASGEVWSPPSLPAISSLTWWNQLSGESYVLSAGEGTRVMESDKPIPSPFYTCMCCCCLVAKSCPTPCNPINCSTPGFPVLYYLSPGQNTGVGSLSLLQGIFPTQGSIPGLPHCRQILYHLSHQGGPRILEWVAYPFSSGTSWPRNRTRVSWSVELSAKPYYLLEFAQNSRPLSWWCHPTISSSVVPFSSCPRSFPASGSFLMSLFFESSGQSTGALESVLPMNIQGWFPLGLTGLISLQSRGLSRVFSGTGFIYSGSLKLSFFTDEMGLISNL